jgi:hypothetical protein
MWRALETRNPRDFVPVVSLVPLDLAGGLLARATAGKARSGIRHFAVDACAPTIDAAAFALDATAGLVVGLAKIVHFRFPLAALDCAKTHIGRHSLGRQGLCGISGKKKPGI